MKDFSIHLKTRVEFGRGVIDSVGEEAARLGKRVLFLYGKESLKHNGIYDQIVQSFKDHEIDWVEHPGVSPNPTLSHAFRGAELAVSFHADLIVAAGGGSVIDEAKAVALGYYTDSENDLWSYYLRKQVPQKALPIIAVMTMPATSSEMNAASVMTNDQTREKFSVRSSILAPEVALLDPAVTVGIPLRQTAFACTDIISHLSEGFFTNTDEFAPVQEEFSLGLMTAVKKSMDILTDDPENLQARSAVMWAGSLGWNGLGPAGWEGARIPCHTLEHPLSGIYDLPHGAGLSIATLAYLTLRKEIYADRIITFGKRVLGTASDVTSEEVLKKLKSWYQKIGTPVSFAEWDKVPAFDIGLLTSESEKLNDMWKLSDFEPGEIEKAYRLMENPEV